MAGGRATPTAASSAVAAALLPFAQLEIPGRLGPADGRYLVRPGTAAAGAEVGPEETAEPGEATEVLVLDTLGAPRSRGRLRRGRPLPVESDPGATPLVLSRVTVVRAHGFADRGAAQRWLERTSADRDAAEAFVGEALGVLNRALHAHRAATQDPYTHEVGPEGPVAVRLGYGAGPEVVEGRWSEARELPREEGPRRRRRPTGGLEPQERLAAVLGGREDVDACETLILRARLDLDAGRPREAALQLRIGLEALLAERKAFAAPGQERDLAALEERRGPVEKAAREALGEAPRAGATEEIERTLVICERVTRRRRLLEA